jgi:arylsulfatase I/J
MFIQAALLLVFISSASAVNINSQSTILKPHIVFLMVDDWGWANVGYHRSSRLNSYTPNIDSLVKEGLQLDQHYVYNWCAPSRSAFLTGRLPIHVNDAKNVKISAHNPNDPVSGFQGVPRNMTMISAKMKEAGYATHQVGKWHVGFATPDHIPKGRGFDTSFGYFNAANDYYTKTTYSCNDTRMKDLWDTDRPVSDTNSTGENHYEEALFRDRLLSIVSKHDPSEPLFLYYAPHIAHSPYQVPQKYLKKFDFIDNELRQVYHAMVSYLDDVVGELVQALKTKELWDNLLFIASSDNGGGVNPGKGANNYPLKGGKHSDWQGGVRVNAFASGGYLPARMRGKMTEGYIHIADWYATFCALAGVDPTDTQAAKANLPPIDSLNMWPLISGQNSISPRVDIPISMTTLISGNYKILRGTVPKTGWAGPVYPNNTNPDGGIDARERCGKRGCLYDIINDPGEHNNLALQMPRKLKKMQKKLSKYRATHFNPYRGEKSPAACEIALNEYGGFWGPFIK